MEKYRLTLKTEITLKNIALQNGTLLTDTNFTGQTIITALGIVKDNH